MEIWFKIWFVDMIFFLNNYGYKNIKYTYYLHLEPVSQHDIVEGNLSAQYII